MKVIYAFKFFEKEHSKPHNKTFYQIAKLSVDITKKFYDTKLYCDRKSLEMFTHYDITFDDVEILDDIESYDGPITSMPKIIAMMKQTEPYIILDLDCIITQKLPVVSTIQYAYPETHQILLHSYMNDNLSNYLNHIDKYYKAPYEKFKDRFNDWFVVDPYTTPNNCLVIVNNPFMVTEFFKDIFKKFVPEEYYEMGSIFLEQFLLYHYIKNFNVDVSYLNESFNNPKFINLDCRITTYKFLHFLDYNNDDTVDDKIEYISKIYNIDLSRQPE